MTTEIIIGIAIVYIVMKLVLGKKRMHELKKMSSDQYTLIDVRSRAETAGGMLENAVNIPVDELSNKINMINKTKPVYTYCASGTRSGVAVNILKKNGLKAYNLGSYSMLRG
jgi:rhodanese-related sulfurtransferase